MRQHWWWHHGNQIGAIGESPHGAGHFQSVAQTANSPQNGAAGSKRHDLFRRTKRCFFRTNRRRLTGNSYHHPLPETNKPAILQITEQGFRVLQNRKNEHAFRFERQPNQAFLFEENLGFKNRLYLIGGGHCALALSELMSKLDFHITLFDDRADLNTFAKNRFAHQKHRLDSYENIGELIPSGNEVYVVVMTVGYRTDEVVIRQLLAKNFRYFGVLGSAAKMTTLLNQLRGEGVPEAQLVRIRTPIGIPINSRTPEEIAVSVAGEVIQIKNANIHHENQ